MKYTKPKHKDNIPKEIRVLNKICKECDRRGRIPYVFCTECWKDMNNVINLKGNTNG